MFTLDPSFQPFAAASVIDVIIDEENRDHKCSSALAAEHWQLLCSKGAPSAKEHADFIDVLPPSSLQGRAVGELWR